MNNISNNLECVGCFACQSVCPTKAIKMTLDCRGFYVPIIDFDKCVNCELCIKKCPIINLSEEKLPIEQYAGWTNIKEDILNSSSGGMFISLAKVILKNNGIVFGAVYSNDFTEVYHTDTDNVDIKKLQKSKYVTSNINNIFDKILELSKTNRQILFVGTPCQCAGLRQLIGYKDNVFLVDFICGGNSSAKAFKEYMINKQRKHKLLDFEFRSKKAKWGMYYYYYYENGKIDMNQYYRDPYFVSFVNHISSNPNCDTCKFRKRHQSDLTIADFWGYRNSDIEYREYGISFVAVNNEHGKDLLNKIENCEIVSIKKDSILYAYDDISIGNKTKELKHKFLEDLKTNNFCYIYRKYYRCDFISVYFKKIINRLNILLKN